MTSPRDTQIGGADWYLHTTQWTDVLGAGTVDSDRRQAATCRICSQYWKPVYGYLRRRGFDNESAKDLTQGFFAEIVLGRRLLASADQAKGRFRTFLLTALDRYVVSVYRHTSVSRRHPAGTVVSLEGLDLGESAEPADRTTPEQAFTWAWASALLEAVLAEVREDCESAGLAVHWQVFRARVLTPILDGVPPEPLEALCGRLGIPSPTQASNMLVTVKRRFVTSLRDHLRDCVDREADIDAEIEELTRILAGGARL